MKQFANMVKNLSLLMDRIAGLGIFLMMIVVVGNVIMRAIFKHPLLGAVDYVNILIAISVGMSLAYCAIQNGHIAVEFLFNKMPKKIAGVVAIISDLLAMGFWILAAWQTGLLALSMNANGVVSSTSQIPLFPVVYAIALGLLAISLVLSLNLIGSVRKVLE